MKIASTPVGDQLPPEDPNALPTIWRERAGELRRIAAAEQAARAFETAANDLEQALTSQGDRLLGVKEAAALVDRHRDTIGNAVRDGRLANYGSKTRPRVKFADVVAAFGSRSIEPLRDRSYRSRADARISLETRPGEL